jgi:hypothetical protein
MFHHIDRSDRSRDKLQRRVNTGRLLLVFRSQRPHATPVAAMVPEAAGTEYEPALHPFNFTLDLNHDSFFLCGGRTCSSNPGKGWLAFDLIVVFTMAFLFIYFVSKVRFSPLVILKAHLDLIHLDSSIS